MKVNGQTMYVAQFEGEDYTYNSKDEAIDKLRENGDEIDPESEDVSIVEVDFSNDDWAVMELPWQEIALQLLKED